MTVVHVLEWSLSPMYPGEFEEMIMEGDDHRGLIPGGVLMGCGCMFRLHRIVDYVHFYRMEMVCVDRRREKERAKA